MIMGGNDDPTSDDGCRMSSHLDPLHKTMDSLREIRVALSPFLRMLDEDDVVVAGRRLPTRKRTSGDSHPTTSYPSPENKKRRHRDVDDADVDIIDDRERSTRRRRSLEPHKRAEAMAAVALALGTLRYMGARLRGSDAGRKKGDPLRAELDGIRAALVSLRELEKGGTASSSPTPAGVGVVAGTRSSTDVDADAVLGGNDCGSKAGGRIGPSKKTKKKSSEGAVTGE